MTETINTFWGLISNYSIEIPQLQRDYAQGRKTSGVEQIRKSLISEIYEALASDKKLVLNFIYGERAEQLFVPIDGQQRLTTLFLVHWYIFKQAKNQKGLNTLNKFSYKTRNSSQRFCKRILEVELDFSQDTISKQIEDAFWFSGNFSNDPTIASMLVVIDTIHDKFKNEKDFAHLNIKIQDPTCPITFLWLPMDNFQKRDDLYIKMNARGKLLTDLEIVKAKLQGSDMLDNIAGKKNSADRLSFISRFNNEYSELFYKYFGSDFDEAMMSFIQAIVRDEFFAYACGAGVPQKEYRDKYKEPISMNGNVFFRFMESGGFEFQKLDESDRKKVFVDAINKVCTLFDIFDQNKDNIDLPQRLNKEHYKDLELFQTSFYKGKDADNFAKYALYEFIYKHGFPTSDDQLDAYAMWKRFVFNIITNTDVAGHVEYICDALVVIKQIVEEVKSVTENGVLTAIRDYSDEDHTTGIKYQLREEREKARLILEDNSWRAVLLDAEEYYRDGQIEFLIDYAKGKSTDPKISKFTTGFKKSKELFDCSKKIASECDRVLMEQALLTMQDNTPNHTAHLNKQSNSSTSWGFCYGDYKGLLSNSNTKEKKEIVYHLLDEIKIDSDVKAELKRIIESVSPTTFADSSAWKKYFVKNDLFGTTLHHQWARFNNCIDLSKNNNNVLLLNRTTVRSYSIELKTFLLYRELIENGVTVSDLSLHLDTTSDMLDNDYPRRFIEWNHKKIAFTGDTIDEDKYSVKDTTGSVVQMTRDEVIKMIKP